MGLVDYSKGYCLEAHKPKKQQPQNLLEMLKFVEKQCLKSIGFFKGIIMTHYYIVFM